MPKAQFYWHVQHVRGPYAKRLAEEQGIPELGQDWEEEIYGLNAPRLFGVPHNSLLDEGERNMLDLYFRAQNAPPTFYLGLHSGSLTDTSTLADVDEPVAAGYARQEITRDTAGWPTLATDSGDYQVTGTEETFEANGSWLAVNRAFLASQVSATVGAVLLEFALSTVRTLVSQDQLRVTPKIKAQ